MTREVMWIVWLCTGMLVILISFYVYLVINKVLDNRYANHIHERKVILEPLLTSFLYDGQVPRGLTHLSKPDLQVTKEILLSYNQFLSGEAHQERIRGFAVDKLTKLYQETIHSRRFAVRMNTLYAIEECKMDNLLPELKKRLYVKKLDMAERFQIYRIMAVLDDPNLFNYLVEQSSEIFPDYLYRDLLIKMGEERLFEYVDKIDLLNENLCYALLDIIGMKGDLRYLYILEKTVNSESKELRIRAMKALSRIGYVHNKDNILSKADSESWEERMMAARVMGIVKWNGYLPSLQAMMRDSSWWVRTVSAQSILRYTDGRKLLQEIAESDNDRYARDMAKEWLEAI